MMDFSLPYSKPGFISFLEGFLPDDYRKKEEVITIPFQSKYFEQATYLGESNKLNLSVYEVRHTSEHDARVGLTREMFRLMAHFGKRRSLVVLVPQNGNTYRFSLVTIDLKLDETGKITREYSNPKRYSFILGEGAKLHTPQKFLISQGRVSGFDDLLQRFSVEVVNKEFYNQIAVMFSRLVGGKRKQGSRTHDFEHVLELPSTPYSGQEQKYKEFAVRLIGRTVFCWFLKKKKSANNIPLIPEDVLSTFAISFNPNYYHSRVEPLFFNVLNAPINERTAEFKEKPYDKIPFLNGGLFEPQPDDFYTGNYPNYALKIPDEWWKDFIEILETYNFTIDENTSIDIDLSVDPEMLGRIFENLLAEINPETGESARKSTGSYYTPRPIVEYMVDESLKQYLVTKTGMEEANLETLLDYSREESGLEPDEEQKVIEALNKIKVLDPACGSGAFPMGILQKMLLILQKVDHEAKNSIQQILNDIQDPVYRKLLESKLKAAQVYDDDDLDDYARKLNIIRRSIYGVDIQPVAVDIAKLRFFLSIIVDEVIQDELPNRGIEPLPNLEFKFVCANTLIPLPPNRELFENADFIEKLEQLREQYFISFGEEKEKIKKEFRSVQAQMFNTSIDLLSREPGTHNDRPQTQTQMLATWNPFSNETTKWFDPKWMFGETEGFDVVIGNPPWGSKSAQTVIIKQRNRDIINRMTDSFMFFINESTRLMKSNGFTTFIIPDVFLYQGDNQKLRSKLINKFIFQYAINLGDFVFNEVTRASCIIGFRNNVLEKYEFFVGSYRNKYTHLSNKQLEKIDLSVINKLPNCTIPTENIKGFRFYTGKDYPKLSDFVDESGIQRGVSPDFKDAFIIDEDVIEQNGIESEIIRTTITGGKDVKAYNILDKSKRLIYTTRATNPNKIPNSIKYIEQFKDKITCKEVAQNKHPFYSLHRPRSKEIFDKPEKLVGVITSDKIIVAIDDEQIYPTDGIYILSADKRKTKNYFLECYLNSKLATFFYQLIANEKGRILAQIKPVLLGEIPFIDAGEHLTAFKLLSTEIHKLKRHGNQTDNVETQIDLMVYKLYELTWDEALIVDPELPGIISREDYEKAGVEELAEWEV